MKKNPIICLRTMFCLLLLFVSSFTNLLFAQLAGNYTINPNLPASATNYLTFTSAVSDLVSGTRSDGGSKNGPGVKAAVVFNVADGTYKERVYIKYILGTSASRNITFQSLSKDSTKVRISPTSFSDNSILTLDSVEYLTFKGLTFESDYLDAVGIILLLKSNNNKFFNNRIRYLYYRNLSWGSAIGINSDSSSYNIFNNNFIEYGLVGIDLHNYGKGNEISENIIDSANSGINVSKQIDIIISKNNLRENKTGINLVPSQNSDLKVFSNKIIGKYSGVGVPGIFIMSTGNYSNNISIYNNIISIFGGSGVVALKYYGPGNAKIYNNSFWVDSFFNGSIYFGINPDIPNPQISNIEVFNNNFINKCSKGVLGIDQFKEFNFKSDNNNFYSQCQNIASIDGVNINSLYALRQLTKTDSNSISVNPAYVSSTDLHVRNPALDGKGKPLAEVTDDFDGEPRSLTAPDIGADEFTPVFSATDSVWPGDANYDRTANVYDVLNIGVAYNTAGTSRTNASTNWTAQAAIDWSKSFSNSLNYKHADCNGDGKVDANDLQPILLNYGKTHNKTGLNKTGTPNDPALYVQFPKDSFLAGDTVVADLYLGTNNISVRNGYGFAFTLNYNPLLIDSGSFSIDLSSSWFGKQGTDMIYLVHDDYSKGQVDIGITRINQKNVSGYGKIGTASFVLQENIAAKRWINRTITLEPSDVKMISADETEIPIYTIADSVKAHQFVGINEAKNIEDKEFKIYPNPVQEFLTINAAGQGIKELKIINLLGQTVYFKANQNAEEVLKISTVTLPKGIYTILISTKTSVINKQIIKN